MESLQKYTDWRIELKRERQKPLSEKDIARPIVQWLIDESWEVYQEVRLEYGGPIADIVAVRAGISHVIEVKRSLSLAVIAQANAWKHFSHYVSVGVPESVKERTPYTQDRARSFAYRILEDYGIGIFSVGKSGVDQKKNPCLNRQCYGLVKRYLLDALHDDLKTYAEAGSKSGRCWTPFKATCQNLRDVVEENPGIEFKAALELIADKWHYSSAQSARSSIGKLLGTKAIPGIRIENEGRKIHLYLADGEEA